MACFTTSAAKAVPTASARVSYRGRTAAKATPARRNASATTVAAVASADEPRGLAALAKRAASGAAALGLAATMALGPMTELPATAGELDVLSDPIPTAYIVDDGAVLSRNSVRILNKELSTMEKQTGYKLIVVTLRKLALTNDPFAFADKVIENWYPTAELGDKKGVILVIKSSKDGAVVGGPGFTNAVGSELLESILTENYPILLGDEKYNEAIVSSVKRIAAKLEGADVPLAPGQFEAKKGSNFKTKEQTENKRDTYVYVVGGLLVISFVVPMVQYYGYVLSGEEEEY